MLFFLRKAIEALLLPMGASTLLIVAAVFLRRRWLGLAAAVMLCFFSLGPVGWLMLWPLERVYRPMTVADAPRADAIVVLSGSIMRGKTASGVQWDKGANRFFAGVDLALAGKAARLVISTGDNPRQGGILREVAVHEGFPSERIALTPLVSVTQDEALAVAQIPGIHSILLVTSAFHMPRAAFLFRARGFEVMPFPTDQRVPRRIDLHAVDFIPGPSGLDNSDVALREYYGLAVYRSVFLLRPSSASASAKKLPTVR